MSCESSDSESDLEAFVVSDEESDDEEEATEDNGEIEEDDIINIPITVDFRWSKPICSGWGKKYTITARHVCWRKRFFVLNLDGTLWYFKSTAKKKPQKIDPVIVQGKRFWVSKLKDNCIQIEREKAFHFFTDSQHSQRKWISSLQRAGGIYDNHYLRQLPSFFKVGVSEWSEEQVRIFLHYLPLNSSDSFGDIYENNIRMNGKDFLLLNRESIEKLGLHKKHHENSLYHEVRELVICQIFDLDYHNTLSKVLWNTRGNRKLTLYQKREISKSLSFPRNMNESYLSSRNLSQFLKNLKKEVEGRRSNSIRNSTFRVKIVFLEEQPALESCFPMKLESFSPIMDRFRRFSKEINPLRTALIIGPYFLEWNESNLVVPKRTSKSMSIICKDYPTLHSYTKFEFEEMREKLSKLVCKWNIGKMYSDTNPEKLSHVGNSQDFVDSVLKSIGIKIPKGYLFDEIRKHGKVKMEFAPGVEFSKYMNVQKKVISFQGHQDLDIFVDSVNHSKGLKELVDFEEEYEILRIFDRCFWMRYYKFGTDWLMFQPMMQGKKVRCPLKDPRYV